MKLGNSGGNNTGKKYLTRSNISEKRLRASDYERLDDFNTWYVDNFDELKNFLISKNTYDDDVFNDTYVRICEILLYTDSEILSYKSYFHRSYYTNYIQSRTKETRYQSLNGSRTEYELADTSDQELERIEIQLRLYDDTLDYIKNNFSELHYAVFVSYISLEKKNYQTVACEMGIPCHKVQRIVSTIKTSIRQNEKLIRQRQLA